MLKTYLLSFVILSFSWPLFASEDIVNIYSARKEKLIKPLLDQFTKETGIKVNLVTGKADALLKRLMLEGKHSPADLFITTDAGRLHRAKAAGVLQSVSSPTLINTVPSNLRDKDNMWWGLTTRARVIFYSKERVTPSQLSSYEDLATAKWKGKICVRSSNNIYNQSLVASMIASNGTTKTQDWANGFVQNFAKKPKGGDRDQIKAVAAGRCDIAIANTYYFGAMINGKDAKQKRAASKVGIFFPNQNGRGAHVNVSGIALTKSASHKANAIALIDFLLSPKSQSWYAEVNNEYPVQASAKWRKTLESWGKFKGDQLNLSWLGEHNSEAVRIMDKALWR